MIRNILSWLEEAAECAPDRTAYDSPSGGLTWGEVLRRAKQIGTCIARQVSAQSPVLIFMDKSPECVTAMLGAVFAGCFYTPLDSTMPEARMKRIAEVLEPAAVICEKKYRETAERLAGQAIVTALEEIGAEAEEELLGQRRAQQIDTDLLYVLFTSGSTGMPKGVSITHRSVIDFIEWACEALQLPDQVRFGSQAPFYFDNSVLDLYGTMRKKGSLFLIPKRDFLFPRCLIETLGEQRIDTIFWVPSALTAVASAEVLETGMLPELRRVLFCGETMPCRTLNRWKAAFPEADFVNMYGPTEITDVCTWYRVDREFSDTDSLPIGRPCGNTRIYLIDGELCVGGTCLSPGYYNAPDKTEAAFVQNPLRRQIPERIYKTGDLAAYNERGELMFLGRRDSQIKRSGYRIELGEIECALNAVESVTLGCCWYEESQERIMAAYTGEASEKEVKAALKNALPRYMLPDGLLKRGTMPQTGSGKIDRLALKQEVANEHSVI